MNRTYTKIEFQELDFDSKCAIIQTLLTDDYFNGQEEINFYLPPDFNFESEESLPETPPEIKEKEDEKFSQLIEKLTDKLFESNEKIEFDLEEENND
jgi:hypothetical protein